MTAKNEPAVVTALATACINAVVLFTHIGLSTDQKGAIVTVAVIIGGFFVRSKVKPVG